MRGSLVVYFSGEEHKTKKDAKAGRLNGLPSRRRRQPATILSFLLNTTLLPTDRLIAGIS
jgi:hypothetical protein